MRTMKRSIFVMGITAAAAGLPRRLRAQTAPGLTSIRIGTAFNDDATPVARTLLTGIPPLTYVAVQVAVKDSVGLGAWSQAVTILVTK